MKDRDGQSIVALPAKHIQAVSLKFSDDERQYVALLAETVVGPGSRGFLILQGSTTRSTRMPNRSFSASRPAAPSCSAYFCTSTSAVG